MISTAGYYCSKGHVWQSTTSTIGHDSVLARPCTHCALDGLPALGYVFGPFPDMDMADEIRAERGVPQA